MISILWHADAGVAEAHRLHRGCGDAVEKHLDRTHVVEVVEQSVGSLSGRHTVGEFEGTQALIDTVGGEDLRWNRRVVSGWGGG